MLVREEGSLQKHGRSLTDGGCPRKLVRQEGGLQRHGRSLTDCGRPRKLLQQGGARRTGEVHESSYGNREFLDVRGRYTAVEGCQRRLKRSKTGPYGIRGCQ